MAHILLIDFLCTESNLMAGGRRLGPFSFLSVPLGSPARVFPAGVVLASNHGCQLQNEFDTLTPEMRALAPMPTQPLPSLRLIDITDRVYSQSFVRKTNGDV